MAMTYQEYSKNVANEFIQSIAFIDDRAYQSSDTSDRDLHDFDAQAISLAFAKHEKLCAVYQPAKKEDIDSFSKLAQKADVTVIDWQINLSESLGIDSQSSEEDDETDDERGLYTKQIIVELLKNNRNGLKLIVVYTGETDLAGITENIRKDLNTSDISLDSEESEGTCTITASPYFKILVIGKNNSGEATEGKVNYEDLPDFILTEFAKLTAGLLSNFALKSLTEIRKNFYQILALFPAKLDRAYLANQACLGTEDKNEQLIEVLGDTFISILRANKLQNPLDQKRVDQWFESHGKLMACETKAKALYKPGLIKEKIRSSDSEKSKSSVDSDKKCSSIVMEVFKVSDDENKKLARLFHHKDLIDLDKHTPVLSLGTVVKSTKENGSYYVCIQQRCDSIRLTDDEPRRFLFLSLKQANNCGCDLLTPGGTELKIDKKTYGIRTVKFNGIGEVVAQCGEGEDSCKYFTPFHEGGEKFKFIFELKDLYAQRIVSEYSANLTRVGLDESEWMRINK